jgi:hypothetical protein
MMVNDATAATVCRLTIAADINRAETDMAGRVSEVAAVRPVDARDWVVRHYVEAVRLGTGANVLLGMRSTSGETGPSCCTRKAQSASSTALQDACRAM